MADGAFFECRDGLQLYYRDYHRDAAGTPILCLPGLTRNSRDFDELADILSRQRRVLTTDFRGRGRSDYDPDWHRYQPDTYVDDMIELLDTLGIDCVIIIGTSLGGLCGMSLARRFPKRVSALIMNDAAPELNPVGLARVVEYAGRARAVSDWDDAGRLCREIYGEWLPGLDDDDFIALAKRGYREDDYGRPVPDVDPNVGRAVRDVRAQTFDPWSDFMALVDKPVLLLWGTLSDLVTRDIIDKMTAKNPALEVRPIPDRGHVPLLDEPDSLDAIRAFLEDKP
ncbi:MAG: alpha/beta hydrolase [Pseudomonadota bacterium]